MIYIGRLGTGARAKTIAMNSANLASWPALHGSSIAKSINQVIVQCTPFQYSMNQIIMPSSTSYQLN